MPRLILGLACLCCCAALFGQSGPSTTSSPQVLQARSRLVLVPTLVRGATGDLIPGLTADNFRLLDNGIPQKLTVEIPERQPVAILVRMQTDGTAPRQFDAYRKLPTMLDALAGSSPHQAAVVTFDSQTEDIWDFSPDNRSLEEAFTHPVPGDHHAAILDAVDFGIKLLNQQPTSTRRLLLLLSQPQDDGSKARVEDVVRHLGENNITILSVTFSPEKTWLKDQLAGDRQENKLYSISPDHPKLLHTFNLSTPLGVALRAMRTDAAAEIATLAGGEHVRFDNQRSLDGQLALLANHIPNRYLLSFQPHPDTPGYHALTVEVLGQLTAPIPAQPPTPPTPTPTPFEINARQSYWSDAASGPQ